MSSQTRPGLLSWVGFENNIFCNIYAEYVKYAKYVCIKYVKYVIYAQYVYPLRRMNTPPFPYGHTHIRMHNMAEYVKNLQNIHLPQKNMPKNTKIPKYQKYVISNPAWSPFMGRV